MWIEFFLIKETYLCWSPDEAIIDTMGSIREDLRNTENECLASRDREDTKQKTEALDVPFLQCARIPGRM
jgi:hypothetical protein